MCSAFGLFDTGQFLPLFAQVSLPGESLCCAILLLHLEKHGTLDHNDVQLTVSVQELWYRLFG